MQMLFLDIGEEMTLVVLPSRRSKEEAYPEFST